MSGILDPIEDLKLQPVDVIVQFDRDSAVILAAVIMVAGVGIVLTNAFVRKL